MDNETRDSLKRDSREIYLIQRIVNGFKKTISSKKHVAILIITDLILLIVFLLSKNKDIHFYIEISVILLTIDCVYFNIVGTPKNARKVTNDLMRAGIVNEAGQAPCLLSVENDIENPKIVIYEFDAVTLAKKEFEDKCNEIEAALNITILRISYVSGKKRIKIYCVPAKGDLPEKIIWSDSMLSNKDFEIILGESLAGQLKVDLNKFPHLLIGGQTGCGKTVLIKTILRQAWLKNADIYLFDFKNGIDYGSFWHKNSTIVTSIDECLAVLEKVVAEMRNRMKILKESGCENLEKYNSVYDSKMNHIIIAVDEVAEILAKKGLSKDEKSIIEKIEKYLSSIACLGRAEGISLVLSTQRPDADVLTGQIKSNLNIRVCGWADLTLSMMILDNADAVDKVDRNIRGRFLLNNGNIFQGYVLEKEGE